MRGQALTATITASSDSVCQGAPSPVVTLTGAGGTAPYVFTYTVNGTPYTANTSPYSDAVSVAVPTSMSGTLQYTITSVTDHVNVTFAMEVSKKIIVLPLPAPDFTVSSNQCASTQFTYTGTPSMSSYSWLFGDGGSSTYQNPAYGYSGTLTGSTTYTVSLTVHDNTSRHCANTVSKQVTAYQVPDPRLGPDPDIPFVFRKCTDDTTPQEFTFYNFSSTSAINTHYSIQWGDGSPDFSAPTFSSVSHTYSFGVWTLTFTVRAGACSRSQTYTVFIGNVPGVTVTKPANTQICAGNSITFPLAASSDNPIGSTTYTINFGDGTPVITMPDPLPASISHRYDTNSCESSILGAGGMTYSCAFRFSILSENYCGVASGDVYPIYVSAPPKAGIEVTSDSICVGSPVCITNHSESATEVVPSGGTSAYCRVAKLVWKITPATGYTLTGNMGQDFNPLDPNTWLSGDDQICPTFTDPGFYTITIRIGNKCGIDVKDTVICVGEAMTPTFTLDATTGCAPLTIHPVSTTETTYSCHPPRYTWTGGYAVGNCGTSTSYTFLSGQSSASPTIEVINPGTYSFRLTVANACGTNTSAAKTVTVNDKPKLSSIAPLTACEIPAGTTITPAATVDSCNGGTVSYAWSFPGGTPATDGGVVTTSQVSSTVVYSTPGEKTISLQAVNACGTTTESSTLTIYTAPTMTPVDDRQVCADALFPAISFSATPTASFSWTNTNPAIGLPAGGNGSIPSFTARHNGTEPDTATIVVTPSTGGCPGSPDTFRIIVYPLPAVQFSPSAQTICSGDTTLPVTLSSATDSVSFHWSPVPVSGITGILTSGAATIPAHALTNTTSAPITVVYRAYAEGVNSPFCVGPTADYSITVNPRPAIDTQTLVVCSGEPFSIVPTGGANAIIPTGTLYSWAAPTTDAGMSGGAAGANAPAISGVLTNTTDHLQAATYTVTPNAGACVGEPFIVIVTVNLKPAIGNRTDTICSGGSFSIVPTHGNGTIAPPGTTFSWPAPDCNPSGVVTGGSAATGQSAIGQTLVNTALSAATLTYTVTPVAGACVGEPFTVTITVLPAPTGKISGGSDVCLLSPEPALTFTGENGVAPYTFFYTINGGSEQSLVATGSTATVLVPTANAGVYVYSLVRVTDASVNVCSGEPYMEWTVTIALPPAIEQPVDTQKICIGGVATPLSVAYTNGVGTPVYKWYRNTTASTVGGMLIDGATTDTYTPPSSDFSAAGTYYYYATIDFPDSGCESIAAVIAAIQVYEPPIFSSPTPDSLTICVGYSRMLWVTVAGGIGEIVNYSWFANGVHISSSPYLAIHGVLGTTTYTCVIEQTYSGCTATFTTIVEGVPEPEITVQPQAFDVCPGATPMLTVETQYGVGTPSYQWYQSATGLYGDSVAIAGATAATYMPPTGVAGTTYYYCIITFTCTHVTSDIVPVTVRPVPVISDKADSINTGTMFLIAPVTDAVDTVPAGTTYTWELVSIVPPGGVVGASDEQTPQAVISQWLDGALVPAVVTYRVTPRTAYCEGLPFMVEITVFPPFAPAATITNLPCYYSTDGGSIETTIYGGVPPYTVAWTGPGGFVADTTAIYNLDAGDYQLLITDSRGGTYSGVYTVARPDTLALQLLEATHVTCFGATNGAISISVSGGVAPYSYVWTKDGHLISNSADLSGLGAGSYILVVTDANNCLPIRDTIVITEPELLVVSLVYKTDLLCFGDANGVIEIKVEGGIKISLPSGELGYVYTWTGPNGFVSHGQNLQGVPAGEYTVTVEDAFCTAGATYTLTQPDEIRLEAVVTQISCYGADDATVTINVLSGGVAPFQARWNTFITGFYKDNMPPGDYVITVTDATGCASSVEAHIAEPPLFVMYPVVRHVSCYGANDGSIRLYFEGGVAPVSFAWEDDPNAGSDRTHLAAGTYTVHISDAQPCRFDRTFTVIEPSTITLSAAITHALDCHDVNSGAIYLNVSGGTQPYRYLWSTGDTIDHLTAVAANDYMIDVTDANGCTASRIYTVQQLPPIRIQLESVPSFDCEINSNIQLTTAIATGGLPPYTYDWSRGTPLGANGESMATAQEGMAFVTVTDQRGCRAEASFEVVIEHELFGILPELKDCSQRLYAFDAILYNEQPGDVYLWNFGDGTTLAGRRPTHRFDRAGIYTVSLTVTNQLCTYVLSLQLGVEGLPDLSIYPEDPKICPDSSVVITAAGAETYRWSDGTVGNVITVYKEGTYTLQGFSAAGCENERSFVVGLYPFENYTILMDKQEVTNNDPLVLMWTHETPDTFYSWDFGDGAKGYGNPVQHTYTVTDDDYFIVQLAVVNLYGCLETDEATLHANNALHPNTFSPNGDGVNDLFMQGWQLEVYNRNGVLFYRGNEGWDGNYNGRPVSNDTYFYCIFDKGATGAIKNCGYVTVIR
ncbi:MAG: PKD domain-containing protein [Prevotellaceae bacterium]|nr:PKD domain-containing protein [Prevotellaceae bacterium]